jgi:hypothetical protein
MINAVELFTSERSLWVTSDASLAKGVDCLACGGGLGRVVVRLRADRVEFLESQATDGLRRGFSRRDHVVLSQPRT